MAENGYHYKIEEFVQSAPQEVPEFLKKLDVLYDYDAYYDYLDNAIRLVITTNYFIDLDGEKVVYGKSSYIIPDDQNENLSNSDNELWSYLYEQHFQKQIEGIKQISNNTINLKIPSKQAIMNIIAVQNKD